MLVDSRFSLETAAEARIEKEGRKTLRMTQPLLRNPAVPVPIKRLIVSAVIKPSTTYGAELFGEDARCVATADKDVLLPALRACLGFGARSSAVSAPALQRLLRTPPTRVTVEVSAVRLRRKVARIPLLAGADPSVGWLRRMELLDMDPSLRLRQLRDELWRRAEDAHAPTKSHNLLRAQEPSDLQLKALARAGRQLPQLAVGFRELYRCFVNGFVGAHRFAAMGLVAAAARDQCPMCGVHAKETAIHHLLECAAFAHERRNFLLPLLDSVESDDPTE